MMSPVSLLILEFAEKLFKETGQDYPIHRLILKDEIYDVFVSGLAETSLYFPDVKPGPKCKFSTPVGGMQVQKASDFVGQKR